LIVSAHAASSLASGAEAASWRNGLQTGPPGGLTEKISASDEARQQAAGESIESVILRRGSSRGFAAESITHHDVRLMMDLATAPIPADVGGLTQPYLIVNAVDWIKLSRGAYVFDRSTRSLDLLRPGEFRREAAHLDLGQDLAGDAAVNVYWLADLESVTARLGNRGYRAAQLEAAVEGGKLYLAAYAAGLGATGLTFFDDDVTRFFSPHAAGTSVMFLTAVGHPAKRRR
jgi:nitroreductase